MNDIGGRTRRAGIGAQEFHHDPYAMPREPDSFIDLRSLGYVVWRGKVLLAFCLIVGLLLGALQARRFEPTYNATATVLYEPERIQVIEMSDILAEPEPGSSLANQIEILYSTTLLERVVERLGPNGTGDPAGPPDEGSAEETGEEAPPEGPNYIETLEEMMGSVEVAFATATRHLGELLGLSYDEVVTEPEPQSPAEVEQKAIRDAVSDLRLLLEASQLGDSSVIQILYTASDPLEAAHVANTVAEEYISFQRDSRNEDVIGILEIVDQRILDLRENVVQSEAILEEARLDLAARRPQSAEMTSVQLRALNEELAGIRLRLAEAEARYERASGALAAEEDLWKITEFRDSDLITEFRKREFDLLEQLAQESAISSAGTTPAKTRLAALLEQVRSSIRDEARYIVAALDFETQSLRKRESQINAMIRGLEVVSIEQTADGLDISRLERDVLANQTLLQTFVARQREISETANLQPMDARILSRAEPPKRPDQASTVRALAAFGAGGLFLGFAVLFLRDRLNNALHDLRQLSEVSGLPVLASIPVGRRRRNILKLTDDFLKRPMSLLAESVRSLRTSIIYSDPAKQPKVVMFTSSVPGEGKSATAILTGLASQGTGRSTILVNCDLRGERNVATYTRFPSVSGERPRRGLGAYLKGECELEEALAHEPRTGLHILAFAPGERFAESPADVLSSDRFEETIATLRDAYDLVILDTPPTLAVADARILARLADTVVYLVRWNSTSRNAVAEGLREVRSMGVPVTGCAFTLVSQARARKYADNEFIYKRRYDAYFG